MQKVHLRVHVCSSFLLLSLLLSGPVGIFASWGLEVGRADPGDVANLSADWIAFKMERNRINLAMANILAVERQRQLLGAGDDAGATELFAGIQEYWLMKVLAPLQRIAMNPAASSAEAQFAMSTMMGMKRQQQLLGLEENLAVPQILQATEEMASLRCRDEALDECVATGRFIQIPALVMAVERQSQLLGRAGGDLESWAEDALKQCAIYELHFVSKTKGRGGEPMSVVTVRDGRVAIKLETPPGGVMNAMSRPLGELLKGQTAGGNNPFFVSVKCTENQWPVAEVICSPGADSSPIEVRINALDLKHREFYVESEVAKERKAGEDKFSFDFAGGIFSLQSVVKFVNGDTETEPLPLVGNYFYLAHQKDQVGGYSSPALKIENTQRGVYPVMFHFTYADKDPVGLGISDSTEFELIHKPKAKPFPAREREPRRTPARPRPGE